CPQFVLCMNKEAAIVCGWIFVARACRVLQVLRSVLFRFLVAAMASASAAIFISPVAFASRRDSPCPVV
ncbi:MAG: hypothetical protein P4M10_05645, partial [Verrucomicrobiae bacterium]|nr:hypothetical protein [Verrucomicrobiae bacterium]